MFEAAAYLDPERSEHSAALFGEGEPAWAVLSRLGDYLESRLSEVAPGERLRGEVDERAVIGPDVYVAEGAVVEANAVIKGPAWIGAGSTVRSGAYVREKVIAGRGVMLGNSSEFKNCLLFDACEVPHFSYVGDSVLGYRAHLGAGVILSNVRLDRGEIHVRLASGEKVATGLRKFGALIGDRAEIGCNSVISPGSVLGRDTLIHPCTHWRGVLDEGSVVLNRQPLEIRAQQAGRD